MGRPTTAPKGKIQWSKEEEQQFIRAYTHHRNNKETQRRAIVLAMAEMPEERRRPTDQSRLRQLVGPVREKKAKKRGAYKKSKVTSIPIDSIVAPEPNSHKKTYTRKAARSDDRGEIARQLIALAMRLLG